MKKKILYIGQLRRGGTCFYRMKALADLGNEITSFDTSDYVANKGNPISRRIAHRFNIGPVINKLNSDIASFIETLEGKYDLAWIDKGKWITPETVALLNSICTYAIHYTADPQIVFNQSRMFNSSIRLYDLMLTTKPYEVELYKQQGANDVLYINQSYEKSILHPRELTNPQIRLFRSDVTFIGRCEKHYIDIIASIKTCKCNTKVWGPKWRRQLLVKPWLRHVYMGPGLWCEDYGIAMSAAKISLGLLSKRYPETTTTRTFEIPACGTLMLAERTDEHLSLFEEDKEAVYFSNNDELISKADYYLKNDAIRQKISRAGHKRCLKSGYDNLNVMKYVLNYIDRILR